MLLATPVVVFPRKESSLEVLVAHLGRITLSNQILSGWELKDDLSLPLGTSRVTRYNVQVNNRIYTVVVFMDFSSLPFGTSRVASSMIEFLMKWNLYYS